MFRSYVVVALRNLARNKTYALINIAGLVLGLSVVIVLYWIVTFETGFDSQSPRAKDIYQVFSVDKIQERTSHVPYGAYKTLREAPEVDAVSIVYFVGSSLISIDGQASRESDVYFAHPDISEMLAMQWLEGDARSSLTEPYTVALSATVAARLFDGDAIGKTIRFGYQFDLKVTGIIADRPANSNFQFGMLISYASVPKIMPWLAREDYWDGGDSAYQLYVMLHPGTDIPKVTDRINKAIAPFQGRVEYKTFQLQSIAQGHFDPDTDHFAYYTPKWMIGVLTGIGAFLVLIASINFINLTTVQSALRGREIAVRKIMGSKRLELVLQFLVETSLIVFVSVGLSCLVASRLVLFTDQLLTTQVFRVSLWTGDTIRFILSLATGVIVLAGLYPALSLSGLAPIRILRDRFSALADKGVNFRKTLVVVQFTVAQVLVICMLIQMQQIKSFTSRDPGFNKESVVSVKMPDRNDKTLFSRFKSELAGQLGVGEVTFGLTAPLSLNNRWWGHISHPGFDNVNHEEAIRRQWVDVNYFTFFDIPLVAGRFFNETDTTKGVHRVMISDLLSRDMGFKDPAEVIGSKVKMDGSDFEVIGVVADYYSEGLKFKVVPHLYHFEPWNFQTAMIKIESSKSAEALERIKATWMKEFPQNYFEYAFLDDTVSKFYEDDRKFSNFVNLFAIVGIMIGCLGLYGLVSFYCVRRTREVGIRKILGASVGDVTTILSSQFLKLIVISFLFAIPIGRYLMGEFLSQYANAISMDWTLFLLAGIVCIAVAMIPIGFHSIRSALAKPVDSLKME